MLTHIPRPGKVWSPDLLIVEITHCLRPRHGKVVNLYLMIVEISYYRSNLFHLIILSNQTFCWMVSQTLLLTKEHHAVYPCTTLPKSVWSGYTTLRRGVQSKTSPSNVLWSEIQVLKNFSSHHDQVDHIFEVDKVYNFNFCWFHFFRRTRASVFYSIYDIIFNSSEMEFIERASSIEIYWFLVSLAHFMTH